MTLVESDPELHLKPIKVKFSGDGTWVGKMLHLMNFTYTLLNQGHKAMGERGNHCLAIVKVKEDYENIQASLQDIEREMREVFEEGLIVDGRLYKVDYSLGGDFKFLLVVFGLSSATSNYACHKNERGNQTMERLTSDLKKGARSTEKLVKWSKDHKFCCKHEPMFKFIPLDHVVVDLLHLRLH